MVVIASGCYGAGIYGYDRRYVPLDDEEGALASARVPPYEGVRRSPRDYRSASITWFGVVSSTEASPDGAVMVHAGHRIHQERHLCADLERETCRVTVSQRSEGPFTAKLRLRPEHVEGRNRLQPGSLIRAYGRVTGEYDAEGGPVLAATYYRHWPRGQYLTTADRSRMRR